MHRAIKKQKVFQVQKYIRRVKSETKLGDELKKLKALEIDKVVDYAMDIVFELSSQVKTNSVFEDKDDMKLALLLIESKSVKEMMHEMNKK